MNILFFAIGNSTVIHMQAQYALRSFYTRLQNNDQLFILTDSPYLYQNLYFVEVIELKQEEIKDWIGEGQYAYFFRAKLQAIKKFIQTHPEDDLMFADCDTYCIGELKEIKNSLAHGYGVMHKDEGCMTYLDRKKKDNGRMWEQTKGKTYTGITITEKYHMWNSGVVAIPHEKALVTILKAVELCDAFLADGVTCFTLEQWSIAIALQQHTKRIIEAYNIVGHYWHHKYVWCKYIAEFFVDSYSYGRTTEEELKTIKNTNHKLLAIKLKAKRTLLKCLHKRY